MDRIWISRSVIYYCSRPDSDRIQAEKIQSIGRLSFRVCFLKLMLRGKCSRFIVHLYGVCCMNFPWYQNVSLIFSSQRNPKNHVPVLLFSTETISKKPNQLPPKRPLTYFHMHYKVNWSINFVTHFVNLTKINTRTLENFKWYQI